MSRLTDSTQAPFPVPIGWATPTDTNSPTYNNSLHCPDDDFQGPRSAATAWMFESARSDAELAMSMQLAELQTRDSPALCSDTTIDTRYFTDPVWGEVHFHQEPDKRESICFACCPCWLIGYGGRKPPCCSRNQQPVSAKDAKRAWTRFFFSMTMLVSVLQFLFLLVLICLCGGFASIEDNVMIGPPTNAFNIFGAKNSARVIEYGEWWRLITPIMLHSGFVHLVSNLFVQLKVGMQLEVIWGPRFWILIYFFSGVYANLASCILLPDKLGVGASGGICGLIGGELVFLTLTWRQTLPKDILERNALFASLIATILLIVAISALPLMDFAAHCGGFLAGALIGLVVFSDRAQERSDRFRIILKVIGLVLLGSLCISSVVILLLAVEPDSRLLDLCEDPSDC